jgi:hypothetical protein
VKTFLCGVVVTVLAAAANMAHAEPCVGLEKFEPRGTGTKPVFLSQIKAANAAGAAAGKVAIPQNVSCDSLVTVLSSLIDGKRSGGRKLEQDKPLDPADAQANLAAALQDPQVKEQLDGLKRDVSDENIRILYEAAVLDAEGFYGARELLIEKLRQNLGV